MEWKVESMYFVHTQIMSTLLFFQETKCFLLFIWVCCIYFHNFQAFWALQVAQGEILFGKWMCKQEITLEKVGERQKQAQGRGGEGRKAYNRAGLVMG